MNSNITNSALRSILDSFVEGILVVGFDNKITLFNSRFSEMWRIPSDIIEQRDDESLISFVLDQLAEPEYFLKKVKFLYGSDLEDRDELTFKDGRIFERNSFPLLQGDNNPGRVWRFREITDEVKKSNELKKYKNHLEDLVEKRTRDLQEANAKLASFNYTTSHDLQAPLRSISIYSAMLDEDYRNNLDDKGKNCIDRVRQSTQQMESLIGDLTEISDVEQ